MLTSISSRAAKTAFRSFCIWVGPIARHRLTRIDDKKYSDLSQIISGYDRERITRMAVPSLQRLEGTDFSSIPDKVIDACVRPRWIMPGKLLDLRKLETSLRLYHKEQRISRFEGAKGEVAALLGRTVP